MQSVKCFQCGLVGWAGAESCKGCGANLADRVIAPPPPLAPRDQFMTQREVKKGLAVFSLVLGVINLFTVGILGLGAVLGIIVAVVAMSRAKREPLVYGGQDLATAGLITSVLSLVIIVPIGIVAAIAVPNLLASRRAANEGATIATLRRIHSAEATYQATVGQGQFGTLEQLIENELVDPRVGSNVLYGYRFNVELTTGLDNEAGFEVSSVPDNYPNSGRRSFFVNETGVIRAADARGNPATAHDAALNYDRVSDFDPPSRRLGYQTQPAY